MRQVLTRRGFVSAFAVTAGLLGLSACSGANKLSLPDASEYPLSVDDANIKALWKSEETRDGWIKVTNPDGGAELGVTDQKRIIQVNGLAFKDLNGNGKLDLYEDWRQTSEERAKALANELSADEIIPLMWHDGFMSTAVPLDEASVKKLTEGIRSGVSRANTDIDSYAADISWVNAIQEWCENNDPHGIPYMNSTDPYGLYDIPDPHCISASFDKDVWKRAGHYYGRAYRASGLRVDLGPQVDIGSNAIWTRLGGSMTEDPATNRDEAKYFAGGMQSTFEDEDLSKDLGWGKDSHATMFKHYVGSGAVEGGRNDHNDSGKFDVFPGKNFEAHLVPFLDGGLHLDSKTGSMAALMPNYGIAYTEDESLGPIYGGAYNKRNLSIVRNAGWDGMITTDWQILRATDFGDRAHGVKELSEAERFKVLIDATVDQVGGDWAPEIGKDGYKLYEDEVGTENGLKRLRDSARRIFTVMANVQLFDNPYSDRQYAKTILEDQKAFAFGQEASDKSIVMLKNKNGVISSKGISGKPKAYIAQRLNKPAGFGSQEDPSFGLCLDEEMAKELFEVVTDHVGEPTGKEMPMVFGPMKPAGETSEPKTVYQFSDAKLPSTDELKDCEYAIITVKSPDTGAGDGKDESAKYLPISLQYRPYTATTAREVSLAGDKLADGTKENRSYKDQSVTASNEAELDKILNLRKAMPNAKLIVIVEGSNNAQCFHEFEEAADVILWSWASFGRKFDKAYVRILSGKTEPSALLPCQMPKDMQTVEASLEDVPRDLECYQDSEGNTYDFCFGLNWSGPIEDERTKTYKKAALTKPETEVKADA